MRKSEIIYYPEIHSTNAVMREMLSVLQQGDTVIAGKQSLGRGRMGRQFVSPDGGLYMSVYLTPKADDFSYITAAAAVAVTSVLEQEYGIFCQIKWVNDLLLNGKKVCGILAESVINADGTPKGVILGIGLNLYKTSEFPDDVKDIAGWLDLNITDGEKIALGERISKKLIELYPRPESILAAYKERSCVIGKAVTIIKGGASSEATVLGIDKSCGLIVDYGNKTEILNTGEISLKIK